MAILGPIQVDQAGDVGITPRIVRFPCDNDLTELTTSGFLNENAFGYTFYPTDFFVLNYGDPTTPVTAQFTCTVSSGVVTLVPYPQDSLIADNQFLNGFTSEYINTTTFRLKKGQAMDSTNRHLLTLGTDTVQNLATTGLNGLDTGEIDANKIYYVYDIGDSSTKNPNPNGGITSLSSTEPTLPEGYDIFRMVSVIYTNGDSEIYPFSCKGEGIDKAFQYSFSAQVLLLNAGDAIVQTNVDLTGLVPENVKRIYVNSNLAVSSASENSAYIGLGGVDLAANGAAVVLNGGGVSDIIYGTTNTWGGGSTQHAFTADGVLTTDTLNVSIKSATNGVGLAGAVSLVNGQITATFTADPGAGTILWFSAQHATPVLSELDYFEISPNRVDDALSIRYYIALSGATLTLGLGGFECCFSSGE